MDERESGVSSADSCDGVFEDALAALRRAEDVVKEVSVECIRVTAARVVVVGQKIEGAIGPMETFPADHCDGEDAETPGLVRVLKCLRRCESEGTYCYPDVVYEVMRYLEHVGVRPADLMGPQTTPKSHFMLALDHLVNAVESWNGNQHDECHQYTVMCRESLEHASRCAT